MSFDQNDDLYVMQQEHEDSRIWSEYVFYRLTGDCQKINEEYMNVIYHWNYKEGIKEITQEDIDKNKNKYQHYLKMCKALDENIMVLDEKQFSYKEKTPMCCSFRFNMFMPGIYEIHSPDNAKYRDNMTEKLKQEFKEKYY
ncbi:MAG TPA: hypothetical protein VJ881_08320 [Halanaerobiales bacterium]|nr:hypothetical protein [Halanaerobiales bacterium]